MLQLGCLLCLLGIIVTSLATDLPATVPVRLRKGPSAYEGLVEVYHDNAWGHVCDDFWDDKDCKVVCNQLGFSGGSSVKGSATYGPGTGPIWLTHVFCMGNEAHIGECMHEHWGVHECDAALHTEDAGCKCSPPDDGSNNAGGGTGASGTCDPNKIRITPFEPAHPGIGRAEVRDSLGKWHGICDDFWDDVDAAVFCACFNFPDPLVYRAYWSSSLNSLPPVPLMYDAVHCTVSDMGQNIDIGDCVTEPANGRCGSSLEAAAVACTAVPQVLPPPAPEVKLNCDGFSISACFSSDHYQFSTDHLSVSPSCLPPAAVTSSISNGVCTSIDMQKCTAAQLTSDFDHKHYCYNISYSQYDNEANTLLMDNVWSRRACCSVAKNGTVTGYFQPQLIPHQLISVNAPTEFHINCFKDEQFSGNPLAFPATISRGQDVFCRITAETWDPRMFLVVPNCRFTSNMANTVEFQFLQDKCPTTLDLGISYFSFDKHNWGFKFRMPKFQGYDQLYLTCNSYVCDHKLDAKPYCDRSCGAGNNARRRRSVVSKHGSNHIQEEAEVRKGPFIIEDSGVGPYVTATGHVVLPKVPAPEIHVPHNEIDTNDAKGKPQSVAAPMTPPVDDIIHHNNASVITKQKSSQEVLTHSAAGMITGCKLFLLIGTILSLM